MEDNSKIDQESIIEIKTTLPILESEPPLLKGYNFYLKPLKESDLEVYQLLNKDELRFSFGKNKDMSMGKVESKSDSLENTLLDNYYTKSGEELHYGIFGNKSDELIGEIRVNISNSSWPELSCRILNKQEWKKYLYQPMRLFRNYWWSLRRKEVTLKVYSFSPLINTEGKYKPTELLCTHVDPENSQEFLNLQENNYFLPEFYLTKKFPNGEIYFRSFTDISILTTRPLLDNLLHINTDRLYIRRLKQHDIAEYHSLRSQAEVMYGLSKIRPDRDIEETQKYFNHTQPNLTQFHLAVFIKSDEIEKSEGKFIGVGGVNI